MSAQATVQCNELKNDIFLIIATYQNQWIKCMIYIQSFSKICLNLAISS